MDSSGIEFRVTKKFPLSKGEGAVVLAQASYKCVEGVHPVGKTYLQYFTNLESKLLARNIFNPSLKDRFFCFFKKCKFNFKKIVDIKF